MVGRRDCRICEYGPAGAMCKRCTNNKYLRDGVCVEMCEDSEVPNGNEVEGRECR